MSEVVYHLQEVVHALREGQGTDDSSTFRMADFADFAMKVARHMGMEESVNVIFRKLTQEQSAFTLESDRLFELLWTWATRHPGREVTNTDLCRDLTELAENAGGQFPYKDKPRAFAQRMSHLRSNLETFFTVTERPGGGHKTLYTFRPKQEAHER